MTPDSVRHTETWRKLFVEHRRKTKWVCACGWDGREERNDSAEDMVEHEDHLAAYVIHEMRHFEGSLAQILRSLYEFERRPGPLQGISEPRYQLTFRNNASISSPVRGVGGYGASIVAHYFRPDATTVNVAELSHDGYRWVITPHKSAEHGEVLKLKKRIAGHVWQEPDA